MAAATADRIPVTRHPQGGRRRVPYKQKGATTTYRGTLVAINAGYVQAAADTAGLIVVGIATEKSVNAGADGAVSLEVDAGLAVKLNNNAGAVVQADVGKSANVV